jgi:hypothetical protein
MKKRLALAFLLLPATAAAEHLDAIQVKLNAKCSVAEYVKIAQDFNDTWGKDHGYRTEIAVPLQSDDLISLYWLGRSANAAAFGAAWDAWRDDLPNGKSVAARLQRRFDKCSSNESRSSFDLY